MVLSLYFYKFAKYISQFFAKLKSVRQNVIFNAEHKGKGLNICNNVFFDILKNDYNWLHFFWQLVSHFEKRLQLTVFFLTARVTVWKTNIPPSDTYQHDGPECRKYCNNKA
jgi:hypothetical protein